MADQAKPPRRTEAGAAGIRGDIQRGLSGDKKPGFDPAAAPMETDSEAGGTPLSSEDAGADRTAQRHPDPPDHQGSDGDAMRPFPPRPRRQIRSSGKTVLGLLAVLAAIGLAFALIGG
jgi:hypothetical protein